MAFFLQRTANLGMTDGCAMQFPFPSGLISSSVKSFAESMKTVGCVPLHVGAIGPGKDEVVAGVVKRS
jgi:hypothetical protein